MSIAAGMALVAAWAAFRTDIGSSIHRPGALPIMAAAVGIGYLLAGAFPFHIEYRKEAHSFSMSDVPAALALAFLGLPIAIALRVGAGIAVQAARQRTAPFKLMFNGALFAFETALAFAVMHAVTGRGDDDGVLLIGIAAGLAVATLVGQTIVSIAIACFEGPLVQRMVSLLRTSILVSPAAVLIATVSVAPVLIRRELVVLAFVPAAACWLVLRQHGRLGQHHRDLQAVHGFAGLVGRSLGLDEVADSAVRSAARLLRAERAALYVVDADGRLVVAMSVGTALLDSPALPFRHDVATLPDAEASDCSLRPDGAIELVAVERPNGIAVPLRDEDGALGVLVLADRSGVGATWDSAERARAVTLGEQLTASLRKALLHRQVTFAAQHDVLTGDLNRHSFAEQLGQLGRSAEAGPAGGATGVLVVDIHRFKEINDTLGHQTGDRLLIEFAHRIKRQLRSDDVFARFGGDEFAVLVRRPTFAEIADLAEQLRTESFSPIQLDDLDVVVTLSVGVVEVDARHVDVTETLRRADVALFAAKRDRTNVEIYRPEIDRRNPDRLSLLGSLRDAVVNGRLEVHYQPKVDLQTCTVTGAEALVRWQHPTRGWIPPLDFIQLAEESGLIKQVTDLVLARAVETARAWYESAYDLTVSVNLSTHDLLDEQLPTRIEHLLAEHGTPPERLTLEITETALLADTPRTMTTIQRLSALGVRLSLDDFGTGYSSLSYLRRLPVAELKVDQSFVKNLLLDEQDEVIVRSTIDLGHNLGLQVVAEGIENGPVLARLGELGCDIGQGYGISRPLAPELFMTWLQTTDYAIARRAADIWT